MTARAATCRRGAMRSQRGAVLAISLVVLGVLTVLAAAGMASVVLEIRMTHNAQQAAAAYYAAEAGIAQALAAGRFSTDPASGAAQFDDLSQPEPEPLPGQGTAIANCRQPAVGEGHCEYFMRFDAAAGPTPVPTDPGREDGALAYHFVIESVGTSGRGARVELTQGFYVVAFPGEPSSCEIGRAGCGITPVGPPVRTSWRQRGVN